MPGPVRLDDLREVVGLLQLVTVGRDDLVARAGAPVAGTCDGAAVRPRRTWRKPTTSSPGSDLHLVAERGERGDPRRRPATASCRRRLAGRPACCVLPPVTSACLTRSMSGSSFACSQLHRLTCSRSRTNSSITSPRSDTSSCRVTDTRGLEVERAARRRACRTAPGSRVPAIADRDHDDADPDQPLRPPRTIAGSARRRRGFGRPLRSRTGAPARGSLVGHCSVRSASDSGDARRPQEGSARAATEGATGWPSPTSLP